MNYNVERGLIDRPIALYHEEFAQRTVESDGEISLRCSMTPLRKMLVQLKFLQQ